ncbi:hypothetical protein CIPAW_06G019400 [Carya illinoinensis]|uniref:Uncharacterized protein n=1 Tax=Carya illinoinensis TaxID=32201 RepID=A0A8T1Q0E4_CARIL|nr:hypothetical protein CIPAW_06G019400 [Carya illinoinensis]
MVLRIYADSILGDIQTIHRSPDSNHIYQWRDLYLQFTLEENHMFSNVTTRSKNLLNFICFRTAQNLIQVRIFHVQKAYASALSTKPRQRNTLLKKGDENRI